MLIHLGCIEGCTFHPRFFKVFMKHYLDDHHYNNEAGRRLKRTKNQAHRENISQESRKYQDRRQTNAPTRGKVRTSSAGGG
jgi:hypothetical protein